MTTAELVKALQEADPSGKRSVCIQAVGFPGGVGNSWASLPSVKDVYAGFDWHSSMVMLTTTKPIRFNEKAKSA